MPGLTGAVPIPERYEGLVDLIGPDGFDLDGHLVGSRLCRPRQAFTICIVNLALRRRKAGAAMV